MAKLLLKHVYKIYAGTGKVKKNAKAELKKRSGDFVAVKDFSMEINDGEFIVFVGPSGCGKSTTLRMIAGLEEISGGELYMDDRLVNDVDAKDRDIAMVFQSYALYPHLTAYDNIAFGLKMRKTPAPKLDEQGDQIVGIDEKKIGEISKRLKKLQKQLASVAKSAAQCEEKDVVYYKEKKELIQKHIADAEKDLEYYKSTEVPLYDYVHMSKQEIDEKVQWAAGILGIEELLDSKPSEMSGGQRQRIALGRAMVRGPRTFIDCQNTLLHMVFFHALQKLNQIHLVAIHRRVNLRSGLDFQHTHSVKSVSVIPDRSVNHPVRLEVGVIHPIDMLTDKRLDVVTVFGIFRPFERILCKLCFFKQ